MPIVPRVPSPRSGSAAVDRLVRRIRRRRPPVQLTDTRLPPRPPCDTASQQCTATDAVLFRRSFAIVRPLLAVSVLRSEVSFML